MKAILDIGVVCVIVLMMGAVGMELNGRHLRAVLQRKGLLLLTLATQAVALPVLGYGLTRALALPPEIAAGILLLAACPVGDIANVYTLLARASVALSVIVNALSILLAAGTMALAFEAYGYLLGEQFVFAVPTPTLLGRLLLLLVPPVLAGSSLRRLVPGFAETHAKAVHGASVAGIAFLPGYVKESAEWRGDQRSSTVAWCTPIEARAASRVTRGAASASARAT